jgi:hypothetical protein
LKILNTALRKKALVLAREKMEQMPEIVSDMRKEPGINEILGKSICVRRQERRMKSCRGYCVEREKAIGDAGEFRPEVGQKLSSPRVQ